MNTSFIALLERLAWRGWVEADITPLLERLAGGGWDSSFAYVAFLEGLARRGWWGVASVAFLERPIWRLETLYGCQSNRLLMLWV
jgi:hypothetical protein